jgi:hypothetical protein
MSTEDFRDSVRTETHERGPDRHEDQSAAESVAAELRADDRRHESVTALMYQCAAGAVDAVLLAAFGPHRAPTPRTTTSHTGREEAAR